MINMRDLQRILDVNEICENDDNYKPINAN